MAYEFKKLSDVNILEEKKTGLNVLVEDAGEIVKISNDDLNPHNIFMVVDTTYHYGKENGSINPYFQEPISTVVNKFQTAANETILVRGILSSSNMSMHDSIGYEIRRMEDGSFDAIVYYNDLHPLYLSSSKNTITLLEGWEEPAPSIPAPATASVGQTIVVKAVDENGKPTEWEVSDKLSELSEEIESIKEGGSNLVEKVLFEEPEMVFSPPDDTDLYMGNRADPGFQFVEGKTYIVTIDGVAREYIASTLDGTDVVAIGNASFMNAEGGSFEDTGDPILATTPSTGLLFILTNEPGEVHSVKVSMMVEKSSGGVMWVNVTSNGNDEYTADKTYAEIAEAIVNGVIPYCLHGVLCVPLVRSTVIKYGNTYAISYEHDFAVIDYTCEMTHIRIREDDSVMVESFFINEPAS